MRLITKSGLLRCKSRSGKLGQWICLSPRPLHLLHDSLARIPALAKGAPPSLLSSGWHTLRAGVLPVICSGTRQGAQRRCRRWRECAGVGSALVRTRILWPVTQGCIPGESDGTEQENWEVLTRPGAGTKAVVAPCHAGVCWESRTNPNPGQVLTQKGNGEATTLSGGYPQPVLSPSPPAWSRTGSGSGSEHTHLCPLLSERQRAEQTTQWAQGSRQWGIQVHPSGDWLPVCPSHHHVKVSPAAPNPPRSHGWFGRQIGPTWVHTAGPFTTSGSFLARVWW